VGPQAEGKKRFKISLNPLVYEAFKLLCKRKGYGHPSIILEAFMKACLKNPSLPKIIAHLTEEE